MILKITRFVEENTFSTFPFTITRIAIDNKRHTIDNTVHIVCAMEKRKEGKVQKIILKMADN